MRSDIEVVQYLGDPSVLPIAPEDGFVTNGNGMFGKDVLLYEGNDGDRWTISPRDYVFSRKGRFLTAMSESVYLDLFEGWCGK